VQKTKEPTHLDGSEKPWCNRRAILYSGVSGQNLPVKTFFARQALPQGFLNRSLSQCVVKETWMSGQIEASEEVQEVKKGGGRKKLLILLGAPVLLVAIGAGLWFGGILPPLLGMGQPPQSAESREPGPRTVSFLDMPEIVTNLNAPGRRAVYVKLRSKLELARPEDGAVVQASMPRLLDLFQTYLREVRPEELRGSAGTQRLREELVARANIAVAQAGRGDAQQIRVNDVLFLEILVQ
jgi:flagellar FliL protein